MLPVAVATLLFVAAGDSVYESPITDERLQSGVHLGGIGCGKIELMTDGGFSGYTGNSNWDRPVAELPLSFFAAVAPGSNRVARALCSGDPAGVASIHSTRFDGRFPRADVEFDDPDLPFRLRLLATSSFSPGDVDRSAIPGALFRFELTRKPDHDVAVAEIAMAFENLAGRGGNTESDFTDRSGARVTPRRLDDITGLSFEIDRDATGPARNALGTLAVAARGERTEISTPGTFNGAGDGEELRRHLLDGTSLPSFEGVGEEGVSHPGGVLVARVPFDARGVARVDFALAWHAPHLVTEWDGSDHGKAYLDRFEDAFAVAVHLLRDADPIVRRGGALEQTLRDSTLPEWVVRKLLNNLGVMFASTVLTRDGWFGCIESPVTMRGALGTMDQRLSAHAAYTFLFPSLDRREIETFARLQVPAGAISHFTGNFNLQLDSVLVPYGLAPWPDLAGSFALQVDALARWTGDRAFLDEMAPRVIRALRWVARQDQDGDGIPEGGSTFDNRPYKGAFAYTANVYLAALAAGARVARRSGDVAVATEFDELRRRARDAVMNTLWNGRWFDKAYDPISGERSHDCSMAQLAGSFRARLQGLGPLLDPGVTLTATRSMLELNGGGPRLPALDIAAGGVEAWNADCWTQYTETYLLMQAMQQGFTGEAMAQLRRVAWAQRFLDRSPFNVALVYDIHTGERRWGDEYMTSTASWFLPRVLAGFDIDRFDETTRGADVVIDPRPPTRWERFRIPIHQPGLTWVVSGALHGPDSHRRLRLEASPGSDRVRIGTFLIGLPPGVPAAATRLLVDGVDEPLTAESRATHPDCAAFALPEPQVLAPGDAIEMLLVATDSGSLRIDPDQPARPYGAAIELLSGDDPRAIEVASEHDGRWPLVLRVHPEVRRVPGDRSPGDEWMSALRISGDASVAVLPGPVLAEDERRWLRFFAARGSSRAAELLTRDEASRRVRIDATAAPPAVSFPGAPRATVRRDFDDLRTEVREQRRQRLADGDTSGASELTPVEIDLVYLGNPLSDKSTRLRVTAQAAEGRYRIDDLLLDPPPGARVLRAPPPPDGRTFVAGEPYQVQAILSVDPTAQWRRANFRVTLRGAILTGDRDDGRPISFEHQARLSVGYDFVRGFLVCGPFTSDRDPHASVFAPERDGVDPDARYDLDAGWTEMKTVYQGILDLREVMPEHLESGAAYAAVDVIAPRSMPARLLLGSGGGLKVWHDGRMVHDHPGQRFGAPASDRVDVDLTEGSNRLLFKVSGLCGAMTLLAEVVDRDEQTIDGLRTSIPHARGG